MTSITDSVSVALDESKVCDDKMCGECAERDAERDAGCGCSKGCMCGCDGGLLEDCVHYENELNAEWDAEWDAECVCPKGCMCGCDGGLLEDCVHYENELNAERERRAADEAMFVEYLSLYGEDED